MQGQYVTYRHHINLPVIIIYYFLPVGRHFGTKVLYVRTCNTILPCSMSWSRTQRGVLMLVDACYWESSSVWPWTSRIPDIDDATARVPSPRHR